jgi:glycosyltransferase involved in cell wall biosynthesis
LRIAYFTPLPPTPSGIAAYSSELLPFLRQAHEVEVFVDRRPAADQLGVYDAHDFVWRHRRQPYDLTVYQLGNATCHDYMWAYLFRYPGLVVLHDAQLHQARALALTRRWMPRTSDYLAELRANHPEAPPDLGQMIAAGLGGSLFAFWPLVRLVIEASRLTLVHNRRVAAELAERYPTASIEAIEMGVRDSSPGDPGAGAAVRARHGIPADAVVVAAFGGITPEKRITELLRAADALAPTHAQLHVMLVGASLEHFDVTAEIDRQASHLRASRSGGQPGPRVHRTGFVADDDLGAYLAAADICACLRWPSSRETQASWLRCLCAGRPTIVTDLAHMGDVPTIDPRTWRVIDAGQARPAPEASAPQAGTRAPIAVSIDVLDEDHMLRLALDRLVTDRPLRDALGRNARQWWSVRHRLEDMARAYERVLQTAAGRPAGQSQLPAHLTEDGTTHASEILADLGVEVDFLKKDRSVGGARR